MHLIYIDDSGDEELVVFSALSIPVHTWKECFAVVKGFRGAIRRSDGILLHKELHAWKFVSGRGRPSDRIVPKGRRLAIYQEFLELIAELPGARCFNACFPRARYLHAYERLINRINRTMAVWDSHAILFCDQGKEQQYLRLTRRMGVYNPIPSRYGTWRDTGDPTRNIPTERIVEDPVFKDSSQSFFIQAADFVAYSLLRRERPTGTTERYSASLAFNVLRPILVTEATRYDPEGILRP